MAAIYQWYTNEEIVFTTPLYPIEVVEGLSFDSDITRVDTMGVPMDSGTAALNATAAEIETVKIYGQAETDEAKPAFDATAAEIETIKIYADAWYDEAKPAFDATAAEIFAARVEHIQPNEDQVHWDADITNVTRP